jgi:16S rRNA (guanine(966)-N(2))-methyltransferase RsmD
MKAQIRIVAGSLRGRKVACDVNPDLRPTPDKVREALFSILGNAVPGRHFFDVFAGTGVIGLEAISRGASRVTFLERDFRLADSLEKHLVAFDVKNRADIARTDVYRWVEHWRAPAEPVNVFFSPPFGDLEGRASDLLHLVQTVCDKAAPWSVIVLQSEEAALLDELPHREAWDDRRYGRNRLLIWVKEPAAEASGGPEPSGSEPGG